MFDLFAQGESATAVDDNGVSIVQLCAYYGDVSALRHLLAYGATLDSLGENVGLNQAAFHCYWKLRLFLVEHGADVNKPLDETGETPLHAVLCTPNRLRHDIVLNILLRHGANPNCTTKPNVATGCFMRDARTKGETPLHRAAAFGTEETVQLLLDAGATRDVKDMNGDSPFSWASW